MCFHFSFPCLLTCCESSATGMTSRINFFFASGNLELEALRVRVVSHMSLMDSTAVFEGRALAIGLSQNSVDALGLRGWVTHATFAFAVATNPGANDDQSFIDGVLVPILGREDHLDAPKLRRLFYEAIPSLQRTFAGRWRPMSRRHRESSHLQRLLRDLRPCRQGSPR